LKTLELCIDCKGRQKQKTLQHGWFRIACCGSTNNRRGILDILTPVLYVNPDALPVAMNDKVPAGKYAVSTTGILKDAKGLVQERY
jgi:hypothetical protein